MKLRLYLVLTALLALFLHAQAQNTTLTYQGRLSDSGSPANGFYDLRFTLYAAGVGGAPIAGPSTNLTVAVTNGLFVVTLDFGASVFSGPIRWLEIGARAGGSGTEFTLLSPRQALTATPYATYAITAGATASNAVTTTAIQDGAVLAGKIAPGQVVKSLNGLKDEIVLVAGANVDVSTNGNTLRIAVSNLLSNGSGIPIQSGGGNFTSLTNATLRSGGTNDPLIVRGIGGNAQFRIGTNGSAYLGTNGASRPNYFPTFYFPIFLGSNGWSAQKYTNGAQYSLVSGVYDYGHVQDVTFSLGWNVSGRNPLEPIFGWNFESAYSNAPGPIQAEAYFTATGTNRASSSRPWGFTLNRSNGFAYQMDFNVDAITFADSANANRRALLTSGGEWYFYSVGRGSNALNATGSDGHQVAAGISYPLVLLASDLPGQAPTLMWTNRIEATEPEPGLTIVNNPYYGTPLRIVSRVAPNSYSLSLVATGDVSGATLYHFDVQNNGADYPSTLTLGSGTVGINTNAAPWQLTVNGTNATFGHITLNGTDIVDQISAQIAAETGSAGNWIGFAEGSAQTNFTEVDTKAVLAKVSSLAIGTWNYMTEAANAPRHLGPFVHHFRAVFGLGPSKKTVPAVDVAGVALAAIQGLNQKIEEQRAELKARQAEIDELKRRLDRLEKLISRSDDNP